MNSGRSKELDCEKIRERHYLSCFCPKSCVPRIRRGLQMTYSLPPPERYFLSVGSSWPFTVPFTVTKTIWSCQHPIPKQQVYFGAFVSKFLYSHWAMPEKFLSLWFRYDWASEQEKAVGTKKKGGEKTVLCWAEGWLREAERPSLYLLVMKGAICVFPWWLGFGAVLCLKSDKEVFFIKWWYYSQWYFDF